MSPSAALVAAVALLASGCASVNTGQVEGAGFGHLRGTGYLEWAGHGILFERLLGDGPQSFTPGLQVYLRYWQASEPYGTWYLTGFTQGGAASGVSATAQEGTARALAGLLWQGDFASLRGRRAFVPGLEGAANGRPPSRPPGGTPYLAEWIAEEVVRAGGTVALDEGEADAAILATVALLGGRATYRDLRQYYYPYYVHHEDERVARLSAFAVEARTGRATRLLEGEAGVFLLESYIFDIVGVRVEF